MESRKAVASFYYKYVLVVNTTKGDPDYSKKMTVYPAQNRLLVFIALL